MASLETETVRVSVADVAVMDDAELAQFMQKHHLPDGDYDLPIDGWGELSTDERGCLAVRLEAQKCSLAQQSMICCRPLDLDDLDARLHRVSPGESLASQRALEPIARSRSPTPTIDPTKLEIEAYHDLIRNGGRPLYPIDLIHDVYREPENFADLLRPWQEILADVRPEGIFQGQSQRWQDFRRWQNDNRGREDDDGGFPAYVEWQKSIIRRDCLHRSRVKRLAEIEADPSSLEPEWDAQQSLRARQRRLNREYGCRGFRDYAEAVRRRLTSHDFTQDFHLDENPMKQDQLTTWIEYLNYEYWWLDKYTSDIERLEPEHDKLWQELVDSRILKPHETKESVRSTALALKGEAEKDAARKAVERATSEAKRIYQTTQDGPQRLRIPLGKRILMLRAGSQRVLDAKRRYEQIRNCNHRITLFIRETFSYARAKREAARHHILVKWVLDQIPMIEAEMVMAKAKRATSSVSRKMERKRSLDTDPSGGQIPKRAKHDNPKTAVMGGGRTRIAPLPRVLHTEGFGSTDRGDLKNPRPESSDEPAQHMTSKSAAVMVQRPRRSARIVARQAAVSAATGPGISSQ
ncbi:hypothetical protein CABS02_13891 [Colletotrichum abscissum]|uniref:Ankyrin 2,3/unc44 n=1 Tax=Colletotrichum abscissum TaxID=1671311 RepID=A0A9Q0AY10_9PEZI|nr:hypothetical protein CABS02_13891 [Colletotrichum abscissum]